MSKNGIWGGDLEINAISNCYKCNVVVYQDHRPNIELQNFPKENRVIRLAYFGSCHYNSVRGKSQIALSDHSTEGNIVIRKDESSPSTQTATLSKSKSKSKSKSNSETRVKSDHITDHKAVPATSTPKSAGTQPSTKTRHSQSSEPSEPSEPSQSSEASKIEEALKQFESSAALLRSFSNSRQKLDESWKRRIQSVLTEMASSFGEHNVETRETVETEKPAEKQESGKTATSAGIGELSAKQLAKRNLRIIREFERRVKRANARHVHLPGEWCGDLSFDDLVPLNTRLQLLFVAREKQVRGFLTLLTKKCPCHSGAYFKFCCYPKMKAW